MTSTRFAPPVRAPSAAIRTRSIAFWPLIPTDWNDDSTWYSAWASEFGDSPTCPARLSTCPDRPLIADCATPACVWIISIAAWNLVAMTAVAATNPAPRSTSMAGRSPEMMPFILDMNDAPAASPPAAASASAPPIRPPSSGMFASSEENREPKLVAPRSPAAAAPASASAPSAAPAVSAARPPRPLSPRRATKLPRPSRAAVDISGFDVAENPSPNAVPASSPAGRRLHRQGS